MRPMPRTGEIDRIDPAPEIEADRGPVALPSSLADGAALIKDELKRLPSSPGVYRMLDRKGDALYVGKAKNLKKRVVAYTTPMKLPERLRRMVAETRAMEFVETHTEVEALLLESNLIKRLRPRYNVLLRDDKSFPYIRVAAPDTHAGAEKPERYPRITKYRGSRRGADKFFGPFASAGAVNNTLNALQRAFLLRSCSDSVFSSRTRPCLLFQIKRCSAPCVGRIDGPAYDALVAECVDFLSGRNSDLHRRLGDAMDQAAENLEYEAAAHYRDRIRALAHITARQDINLPAVDDADVIAAHREGGQTCIQVFFFRQGRNYGNRAYYPRHDKAADPEVVLGAFLGQFYDNKPPPRLVLIDQAIPEAALIADALSGSAGHKVEIAVPRRGDKRKLIDHAASNAKAALQRRLAESASQRELLDGLADAFGLDATPERIEVYDNSHIQGSNAVGGMIVAGPEGFAKNAYRKFNIKADTKKPGEIGGDDFAMMREVLSRRFGRALKEDPEREGESWPDLVLIDGGKGQLNVVLEVLADLGIEDLTVVGVSKGPDRDAGDETFHFADGTVKKFRKTDPVLYFLQRLRDEAHRFAIGAHRSRRAAAQKQSLLDGVPGIGAARKKALLAHFGSAKEVARAGLADLETVDGISTTVAKRIYEHFHGER
jgi:excinuclease ABC subunit C